MPQFEALYYPKFEPPVNWLRSFLLFFDKIRSIVPKDANFRPSQGVLEITDLIPNAFETISPDEKDIEIDNLNFSRLRKAFEMIKKEQPKAQRNKIKIKIDSGGINIAGYTFLHDAKMTDKVRSLLKEFNLMKPKLNKEVEYLELKHFSVVDEQAGNLIVSHIADRIGRRYGWNTVSDQPIDFIVNSLNSFSYEAIKEPRTMLACSIVNCEIPNEVIHVTPTKYVEIRNAYSDIRESFHRVVTQLNNLYRLEMIKDKEILQNRVIEITREFSSEVEKYRKSTSGRMVKRWSPIGIGSLATLAGAIFADKSVAIASALVSILIQTVQELTNLRETESNQSKVQRLIGNMRKDIIRASEIRKLI